MKTFYKLRIAGKDHMKYKFIIIVPIILILSTAFVFRYSSMLFGINWATLIGFSFYQIAWCIITPLFILGKKEFLSLFKEQDKLFQKKNIFYIILLLLTIIGSIVIFINNLTKYSLAILFLGVPLTIINGTCEEIFWRGVFIKKFKNNIILSIVYPTILFTIWHISSELVNLNIKTIEIVPFILLTLPLGLVYSIVAFRTKSIKWVAIAHSLSGIFAFGVPLSTSLANIIGIPLK